VYFEILEVRIVFCMCGPCENLDEQLSKEFYLLETTKKQLKPHIEPSNIPAWKLFQSKNLFLNGIRKSQPTRKELSPDLSQRGFKLSVPTFWQTFNLVKS